MGQAPQGTDGLSHGPTSGILCCPLRLALYGHPDSGGIWEKHCTKQLKSIGWVPVLPDIWQSIFYHPELDLLLVVYADDFKMAAPKD